MRPSSVWVFVAIAAAACSSGSGVTGSSSTPENANSGSRSGSSGSDSSGADASGSGVGGSGDVGNSGAGASGAGGSGTSSSGSAGSGSSHAGGSTGAPSDAGGGSGSTLSPNGTDDGGLTTYGKTFTDGVYNLGPVSYDEKIPNACSPSATTGYDSRVKTVEGNLLAGLWGGIALQSGVTHVDQLCDSCIWVTTKKGSAMLRVVTYGDTTNDAIDVSQTAFDLLNMNEYPRPVTWVSAKCPATGPVMYEFQTGSSDYWTSLWVRNARIPLAKVEVESPNHKTWFPLVWEFGNGTVTDDGGFGNGSFTIRLTAVDGQVVTDTFTWPSGGIAGAFLTGKANFN